MDGDLVEMKDAVMNAANGEADDAMGVLSDKQEVGGQSFFKIYRFYRLSIVWYSSLWEKTICGTLYFPNCRDVSGSSKSNLVSAIRFIWSW